MTSMTAACSSPAESRQVMRWLVWVLSVGSMCALGAGEALDVKGSDLHIFCFSCRVILPPRGLTGRWIRESGFQGREVG